MLTPKQNLLETLKKDGKPECLCNSLTMFRTIPGDPCFKLLRGNRVRGTNSYDQWGTYIMFPEDAPAAVPYVTEENQVIKDITEWKKYVKVPDLAGKCAEGWEEALEAKSKIDQDKYLTMVVMGTGIFEQLHMLMTFEDTLVNFLLEPEAMHELIDVICEYRLTYMKLIVEHLHPDCIMSHDDWGSKNSLFMSPDTWREFIKPQYEKTYKYMKDHGVIVMHHADSFMEPIVEDMVELGVDIWQGTLPENDIVKLQKQLDGRMTLMGGIDASIVDREDSTEEEIRKEVRRACTQYGPGGHYIPCITYGGPGCLYPHVDPIIDDEIEKYNKEVYGI